MTRLPHVASSPRAAASKSLALATAFLDAYRDAHTDAEIDAFDLWDGSLPEFGPLAAAAKMTVFAGETPRDAQADAWRAVSNSQDLWMKIF